MTFEKFHNRVVIDAKLIATTPIFVGARADSYKPGEVNGACVKDAYGRPYIPGSSLKGVLRAFLSSVLHEPINSKVNATFRTMKMREDAVSAAKKKNPEEYEKMRDDEILAMLVFGESTKVERLFGSEVMAGKVKIADAVLVEDRIVLEVRNGVAIDRDAHTAIGGALFETEVVPAGTVFRFNASADNLSAEEADLFEKLMAYFADGNITVGGRSRSGLGSVELREITVKIHRPGADGFPVSKEISDGISGIKEAVVCSKT